MVPSILLLVIISHDVTDNARAKVDNIIVGISLSVDTGVGFQGVAVLVLFPCCDALLDIFVALVIEVDDLIGLAL